MKTLIRTIILTIAFFIYFPELNSSPNSDGKVPSTYTPFRRDRMYIDYMKRRFVVTFGRDGKTPARCHLAMPNNEHQIIPDLEYRKHHNYVTRALIRGNIRCVVYIEGNGKVLGAKLPPTEYVYLHWPAEHPARLNPDETRWYMTYYGHDYMVHDNITTGYVKGIELMPANVIPSKGYRIRNKVITIPFEFANLHFLVHKRMDVKAIVGAQLDPYWRKRKRERMELKP